MIQIIGQETGKVYAEGHRSDCFRKLSKKYPSYSESEKNIHKGKMVQHLYPEALIIIRK